MSLISETKQWCTPSNVFMATVIHIHRKKHQNHYQAPSLITDRSNVQFSSTGGLRPITPHCVISCISCWIRNDVRFSIFDHGEVPSTFQAKIILNSEGLGRWRAALRVAGLWTCPSSEILSSSKHDFRELGLFPSSGEGRETPTLLGSSERANLN
jgi:hypothetical protein